MPAGEPESPAQRPWKTKLIEARIPLKEINDQSIKEKSIRYGHPSTMHLWWARRTLAACRAVLFAQLVDDPSAHPETFRTKEDQELERKRLHRLMAELVRWDNTGNTALFESAYDEIAKSCDGSPPPILDPFAGGGTIPLEAQRLGLDAEGRDLNPVATLITKALIELPSRWAGRAPVTARETTTQEYWPRATGLAADVLHYGQWLHQQAIERVGALYPTTTISGMEATTIAWLWARTVTCPNPACRGAAPLVRDFWLGKKSGKERYVVPIPDGKRVRFEIHGPMGAPRGGTMSRNGAVCLLCESPIPSAYIRQEGLVHRLGTQLMAIVAEGKRQRHYLPPDAAHVTAADVPRPEAGPDEEIGVDPRNLWCVNYGFTRFSDLFTNRQLIMLGVLFDLVQEARARALADCGDHDYANAIATYLALAVSRITERNCTVASWDSHKSKEQIRGAFPRQSLAIAWDFAEANPFSKSSGNLLSSVKGIVACLRRVPAGPKKATAIAEDAARGTFDGRLLVATDPPYYDNVAYANLSDFFYVWLRRGLREIYPDLMSGLLTPKADEIVADAARHGGKTASEEFFRKKFSQVFERIREGTPSGYPISFFYAHKQHEHHGTGDNASTGWETLLATIIDARWTITATWPIRTELSNRPRAQDSNALSTAVVLACRPRPDEAPATDQRAFTAELRRLLPGARIALEQSVPPADLRQAAMGPAMAVFSRYSRVQLPSGEAMSVRAALSLINRVFDECSGQLEGDAAPATRWCLDWFKIHGFDAGPYGDADAMSRGLNIAPPELENLGLLTTDHGKIQLTYPTKLKKTLPVDPAEPPSEWLACLHLVRLLQDPDAGADSAGQFMARVRPLVDLPTVRFVVYQLHIIAEGRAWQQTAAMFNALGTAWDDLETISRQESSQWTSDNLAADQDSTSETAGSDENR